MICIWTNLPFECRKPFLFSYFIYWLGSRGEIKKQIATLLKIKTKTNTARLVQIIENLKTSWLSLKKIGSLKKIQLQTKYQTWPWIKHNVENILQ